MEITDRLAFLAERLRERLWVKPLAACLLSIASVFLAGVADSLALATTVPHVTADSVESLLSIMAASMLVIATFAVASMVSAYASASQSATPRSFKLVVADDLSQNALSTFVGSFIFSIVALTALKNGFFGEAGRTALFVLTVAVFAVVILTFVRWVDQIARLGRLGTSIDKVEAAAAAAMERRLRAPRLGGAPATAERPEGRPVRTTAVGYVQRVEVPRLQALAEEAGARVTVAALPGAFAAPGSALAWARSDAGELDESVAEQIADAFVIGRERIFDEDPRFGLIVLSEIADRALSPGINDPGTAIAIIGSLVRLFAQWAEPREGPPDVEYDRVEVPELSVRDMFDDAFTALARDGAGIVEVMVRLQKGLESLSSLDDRPMRDASIAHARAALDRAERKLDSPGDLARVREAAAFSGPGSAGSTPPP